MNQPAECLALFCKRREGFLAMPIWAKGDIMGEVSISNVPRKIFPNFGREKMVIAEMR